MRSLFFVFCCLCLFFSLFIGCDSSLDNDIGQGIISFYTGEFETSASSKTRESWPMLNTVNEGYLYLKKIEISTTGQEWVSLVNEEEAIPIHFKYEGELIRIPVEEDSIPAGEYHGLRISIEPKIRILSIGNLDPMDTILDQEPTAIYVRMGMSQLSSSVDSLEFTSANGYLIPFTVDEDQETRVILHIIASADGDEATQTLTRWWTDVEARATKFIY